jgi:Copper type II ascorbate-dependent monooxygenase, C-terminal domain/Copper type II ascorbate-dependent monooxygenase, N-terminal domain
MLWFRKPTILLSFIGPLAGLHETAGFAEFAARIPNGLSVPNPGPQGGVWAGVGHVNAGGGGERNAFGNDFQAAGLEWTAALCAMDSDEDGRSNGIELGDPNCIWVEGNGDPELPAQSHPGIVDEPVDDGSLHKTCDGYVAPDDEVTLDIGFSTPNTLSGEVLTHFRCEQMEVNAPAQVVLDKIKDSVLLDNTVIVHHMFIYWCEDGGAMSSDGDRVGEGPYQCSGNESGCTRVAAWALGGTDNCLPENVGFRMDLSTSSKAIFKIEAHYDNPTGQDQQDMSGMRLYLTPTLRPLRGGSMVLGMATRNADFELPPLEQAYSIQNICPSSLTDQLTDPVYVFSFAPHMHRRGSQLVTEHYRCGQKIGEIGRIDQFEFNNQQVYTLSPPVKILPGDAMVTTCTFDTTNSTNVTFGGQETTDEMCLNFLSIYPFLGTEAVPTRFALCTAFEHGVRQVGNSTIPMLAKGRFALAGRDTELIVRDFESDPFQNSALCCAAATNSTINSTCESLYLASTGSACAIDTDCEDTNAICDGGLCGTGTNHSDESPTATASSDETVTAETSNGMIHSMQSTAWVAMTAFLMVAVMPMVG